MKIINSIRLSILAISLCAATTLTAASHGFAIFVDSVSYTKTASELAQYAQSVDKQGLKSEIVVVTPDVTPIRCVRLFPVWLTESLYLLRVWCLSGTFLFRCC